jgi:hypothetical protein
VAKKTIANLAPSEYVGISAVLGAFGALVVLLVTRDILFAAMVFGIVFVVAILGLAMLMLAMTPNDTPEGQKSAPGTGND